MINHFMNVFRFRDVMNVLLNPLFQKNAEIMNGFCVSYEFLSLRPLKQS